MASSRLLKTLLLILLSLVPGRAQTVVWVGSGAGTNWTTAASWVGGAAPANDGTAIAEILGTTYPSPLVNIDVNLLGLAFSAGTASTGLTSAGSKITVGTAGITNHSSQQQVFSLQVLLNGTQTWQTGGLMYFSGGVGGTGNITKTGTGTIFFNNNNTFVGTTTISAGTIQLGGSLTANTGTFGTGDVINHAAILVNRGTVPGPNIGNNISGTGTLTKDGAGTLILTGVSTYTGGTTIVAGAVQVGSGTAGSLAGNVANSGSLVFGRTDDSAFAGNISGTGGVTKNGAGILTLTGTSSYSGTTTLAAGTILANVGSLGTGTLLFSGGTLRFAAGNQTDYSSRFSTAASQQLRLDTNGQAVTLATAFTSSSGVLTKLGTGTLTLSGANTYTGGTNLSDGVVALGHASALGTAGTITFAGGTLQSTTAGTTDYSSRFSSAASQQYRLHTNGQNVTLASALTSAGGVLTKLGTGTLTLSGANTYTGGTVLSEGILALGSSGALGTTGTLTFGGGTLRFSSVNTTDYSGRFSNLAAQTFNLDTNGQSVTLASSLASTDGTLTKSGTGTLILSAANTFTGATFVTAGSLNLRHDTALGTADAGTSIASGAALELQGGITLASEPLTLSGSGVSSNGALRNISGANAFNGAITLGSAAEIQSDAGTLSLGGNLANSTFALTFDGAANTAVAGTISGSGGLTKVGTGVLSLAGTNTYSGNTTITGGLLELSALANFGSGNLTLNGGGLKWATGTSTDLSARLTSIGSSGGTFDTNGNNITFATTLPTGTSFTKAGAGTLTLPTTSNLGVLTLNAGTLALGGTIPTSSSASVTTGWSATGTLVAIGNLALGGPIQPGPYSAVILDTNGFSVSVGQNAGAISIANVSGASTAFTKTGAGTLTLAGKLASDNVTINGGELITTSSTSSAVAVTGATLSLSGSTSAITLNTGGTLKALSAFTASTGSLTFAAADATLNTNGFDLTLAMPISGAGTFNKIGAGTLTLSNTVNVTGGLLVSAGAVKVTNNFAGNVTLDTSLTLDTTGSVTLSGNLSGAGTLTKQGTGTFTLSGTNSLAGATTVTAGLLQIDSDARLGPSGVTLNGGGLRYGAAFDDLRSFTLGASGATLDTNGFTVTYNPAISGTGALTKTGAGTLALTGTNAFTGGTTVSAGSLQFGSLANLGTGNITLNGGTLRWAGTSTTDPSSRLILGTSGGTVDPGANDVTFATPIASTSAFTKAGTGTLTFTAANTYTGATTVSAGSLRLGASGVIADASAVTVASGATLDLNGQTETIGSLAGAGSVTLNGGALTAGAANTSTTFSGIASGTGSLTKSGTGTLTLSGANTYTGATVINAGSLLLGANGIFPDSSAVTIASGATFNVNGKTEIIGSLAGAGNVALGAGALTMGGDNTSTAHSGVISQSGTLTKTGTGALALTGSNTWTGGLTVTGGLIEFTSLSNVGTGNITLNGGGLRWSSSSTVDVSARLAALGASGGTLDTNGKSVTLATALTGTGALTKTGSGSLTLTAANAHNGTIVSDGSLQLGTGGTTGSVTGSISVASGATLLLNRSDSLTLSNPISGSGTFTKLGSNLLTLTGANPLTGVVIANGGTLQIGAGGTSGSLTSEISLLIGATLRFFRSDASESSGVISGAGSLIKDSSETLTLTGNSSFTGGTTLSAGTLAVRGTSALGTGALALNGGSLQSASDGASLSNAVALNTDTTIAGSQTLTLAGPVTLSGFKALTVTNTAQTTVSGSIVESSPSIFIKQGAGELQLTGASTYSGGTFIQAGTVRINNTTGSALGSGAVTVANGATLTGAGSFTGALQLNGTFSPGNSPGTASSGSQTWAGGGAYVWEINHATGVTGTNYDLLNITGSLTINATSASPFNLTLRSLATGNVAGDLINFNSAANYSYTVATASSGISGFSTDKFTLNTAGFTNALNGGTWSLAQNGNNLDLLYTASAIPEPSTYAALAGLAALALAALRRRSCSRAKS